MSDKPKPTKEEIQASRDSIAKDLSDVHKVMDHLQPFLQKNRIDSKTAYRAAYYLLRSTEIQLEELFRAEYKAGKKEFHKDLLPMFMLECKHQTENMFLSDVKGNNYRKILREYYETVTTKDNKPVDLSYVR